MTKAVRMIARKPMRYATRRLRAGDVFDATRSDALVLHGARIADHAPNADAAPKRRAPRPAAAVQEDPVLHDLRERFEAITGRRPDMRWGRQRIENEIAEIVPPTPAPPPALLEEPPPSVSEGPATSGEDESDGA